MYYIEDPFAYVSLFRELLLVLFVELTSFIYSYNLLFNEGRESDDDAFRLHSLEFLDIDVAYPLVPQIYVSVGLSALGIHCRFHLVRIEDEHSAFSSITSNNSAFLFDDTPSIVEPNLHALFHDLADRDQILRYCWNMQDVLDVGLVALFTEWDITDMLNGLNCVIPSFHIVGSFGLTQLLEPIFMRLHVIGCTRVDKPYIF